MSFPRNVGTVVGHSELSLTIWNPKAIESGQECVYALCALLAVWSTHKQEVVQVVHNLAYTFLLCHPFKGICNSCKYLPLLGYKATIFHLSEPEGMFLAALHRFWET